MDWSKAKTILIVAFLVTNLLLGVVLFSSGRQVETSTKERFIEDVTKILNKKNIFIDTEISREIPSLNTLSVEYEDLDPVEVNNHYFNGEGEFESKEKDIVEIQFDNEYISVLNKKTLIYENKNQEEKYTNLTEKEAKEVAIQFLKDRNYDTSDMVLFHVEGKDNNYSLQFSKIYNKRYLERATTIMEVDSIGVRRLERVWLSVLDEGDTPIYISTAPKAILSLLSMEDSYGKTIIDISLCYYFEPEKQDYAKDSKDVKKGHSIPAWRVLFDDGYKIIIDN